MRCKRCMLNHNQTTYMFDQMDGRYVTMPRQKRSINRGTTYHYILLVPSNSSMPIVNSWTSNTTQPHIFYFFDLTRLVSVHAQ